MKKVVLASMLAAACAMTPSSLLAQPQQNGGVNMSADEYKVYNDCTSATAPADKAAKCEAYLKAYPNSVVKADVLDQLMFAYRATGDVDKTLDAADRTLAANPNDLFAYVFEAQLRRGKANQQTDASGRQAGYDDAAGYAQKALALGQPKAMPDEMYKTIQAQGYPVLYGAIAADDFAKQDAAGAITNFKKEIAGFPPAALTQPGPPLQEVVFLSNAYYMSTPPDLLNCAWYATRAAAFAQSYAAPSQQLANYCYKKYHGDMTGYDTMQAAVQNSVDPPAGFFDTIKPAPKPEDIVAQTIASTPNLATLAVEDKEFILQYGSQKDPKTQTPLKDPKTGEPYPDGRLDPDSGKTYADEVFDTVKGKSSQFPQVTVMDGSTTDTLLVTVTEDAATSKTADFTFKMKEPLKTAPVTGTRLDLEGAYDSYTAKPLMINMTDGAVVDKKKPVAKPPVHHTPARH